MRIPGSSFASAALLGGSILLLAGAPSTGFNAKDDEQSFVGKRLPALATDQWYTQEKISTGMLRGQRWALCMISVQSTNFAQHLAPLERLHRPHADGGPVVILLCMDDNKDVVKALAALPAKPSFYVARDSHGRTGELLGTGRIPYYYFVDEEGKVYHQGAPDDPGFQEKFMELLSYRGPKPEAETPAGETGKKGEAEGAPKETLPKLPQGFVDRCNALLKKGKTAERIQLLREAHKEEAAPDEPDVRRLWDHIQAELEAECTRCRARLERGEFQDARRVYEKIVADFEQFPPAAGALVHSLWSDLGEKEGGHWFERVEVSIAKGAKEEARTLLERITKTYPDSSWAERARKMLSEL